MSKPKQPQKTGKEMHASGQNAAMNFSKEMDYGDYLELDAMLSAQHPRSGDHNEMLFIIQHQTSELWMKLALHELGAAQRQIRADHVEGALKMLARVSRIMEQLVQAWSVLSTMTPSEYEAMRPSLGMSSGFQSYQYRQIEFMLGNKNPAMLQPHVHHPERHAAVLTALENPSLYDDTVQLLARRGLPIAPARLMRDAKLATEYDETVEAAWLIAYRDPARWWEIYALAEKLVDLEDAFRLWRFRHVTTVERIIGFKRGTGGTAGVNYLRKRLDVVLFPELWGLRTQI
jgi:tryptophan 2,3-dioxygenase